MWLAIIVTAVVAWLSYKNYKDRKQKNGAGIQKDNSVGTDIQDMSQTDKDWIYAEVKKRKVRAEKLGVPELITKEYHEHIQHYPSWIKDKHNRSAVFPAVTDAVELEPEKSDKYEKNEKVKITLKEKNYTFSYREHSFVLPDGEYCTTGDLELYQEDKKILALSISVDYGRFDIEYSPSGVEAFIEGDWISDFKDLAKWHKEEQDKFMQNLMHPPDEIDRLKKDFGIKEE